MPLEEMNAQFHSHSGSRSSKREVGLGLGKDDAPFAPRPPPDSLPSYKRRDASVKRKHRSESRTRSRARRHTHNPTQNTTPNHTRTASAPNSSPSTTPGPPVPRGEPMGISYSPPSTLQSGRQEALPATPGPLVSQGELGRMYSPPAALQPGRQEGPLPTPASPAPGELARTYSPPAALQPGRQEGPSSTPGSPVPGGDLTRTYSPPTALQPGQQENQEGFAGREDSVSGSSSGVVVVGSPPGLETQR